MSVIEITRNHTLGTDEARKTANELAVDLSERFSIDYDWSGDVLKLHRSGVKGQLEVDDQHIHIKLELGFMLRPFKDRIEREIHDHIDNMDGFA